MAKIELSTIRIVDVLTGNEFSYQATTTPKVGTLGNSYFGTLSSKGIAKLQEAGLVVNNEKDWCNLLRATFKLDEEDLGTRGEKWSSPDEREKHKVFINDIEFNPEFTSGQLKRIQVAQVEEQKTEAHIETPAIAVPATAVADITPIIPQLPTPQPQAIIPEAVVPTPVAQPQVITPLETGHITKLKKYIADGKYSKEQLIGSLTKQVGKKEAKKLYDLATAETIPLF